MAAETQEGVEYIPRHVLEEFNRFFRGTASARVVENRLKITILGKTMTVILVAAPESKQSDHLWYWVFTGTTGRAE